MNRQVPLIPNPSTDGDLLQGVPERVLYVGPQDSLLPEPERQPGNLVVSVLLKKYKKRLMISGMSGVDEVTPP